MTSHRKIVSTHKSLRQTMSLALPRSTATNEELLLARELLQWRFGAVVAEVGHVLLSFGGVAGVPLSSSGAVSSETFSGTAENINTTSPRFSTTSSANIICGSSSSRRTSVITNKGCTVYGGPGLTLRELQQYLHFFAASQRTKLGLVGGGTAARSSSIANYGAELLSHHQRNINICAAAVVSGPPHQPPPPGSGGATSTTTTTATGNNNLNINIGADVVEVPGGGVFGSKILNSTTTTITGHDHDLGEGEEDSTAVVETVLPRPGDHDDEPETLLRLQGSSDAMNMNPNTSCSSPRFAHRQQNLLVSHNPGGVPAPAGPLECAVKNVGNSPRPKEALSSSEINNICSSSTEVVVRATSSANINISPKKTRTRRIEDVRNVLLLLMQHGLVSVVVQQDGVVDGGATSSPSGRV